MATVCESGPSGALPSLAQNRCERASGCGATGASSAKPSAPSRREASRLGSSTRPPRSPRRCCCGASGCGPQRRSGSRSALTAFMVSARLTAGGACIVGRLAALNCSRCPNRSEEGLRENSPDGSATCSSGAALRVPTSTTALSKVPSLDDRDRTVNATHRSSHHPRPIPESPCRS